MSDLDKLLFGVEKIGDTKTVIEICKNATRELVVMRRLLLFALNHADEFTENDPDGVKANWIEQVEKWNEMP